jgi:hypothetical protein
MLPLELMSGKVITIFDQNSLLYVAISLHLASHLLVVGNHYMAKEVVILIPIALVDGYEHLNEL